MPWVLIDAAFLVLLLQLYPGLEAGVEELQQAEVEALPAGDPPCRRDFV
jgi:hypothetical protein